MSVPSHPLKHFSLAIGLTRLYEARSFNIKPFSERAKAVLNDVPLNNINIQKNNILAFPPWDVQIFNYHNPFLGYDKAGTAAIIYQQLFSYHRNLLEQASISFIKEGVKFNKYENHAQLMQISAENLQEELDLRHVENRFIKKELEKLIQDYKPEKAASTDVTMRIILKDEEPVCQPPRRLSFTERQEVNR
ncbi:retrovirus-related Pol polyprotein from transposon 412 [Trichonephila clavipes]|nr:retrovirus-related Pol polyprotein from transposon 412 [Trichonephila clavipes]